MKLGFFIKISILVISFIAVIYIMRFLHSSDVKKTATDPNSVVGLLVGGDYRLLNWCPEGLKKIEIYSESGQIIETLTSKEDFVAVCGLMVGGITQDPAHPPFFKTKLVAYPHSGNPVSLDMDSHLKLFQVKGMPFSCPGLIRALDRLALP